VCICVCKCVCACACVSVNVQEVHRAEPCSPGREAGHGLEGAGRGGRAGVSPWAGRAI